MFFYALIYCNNKNLATLFPDSQVKSSGATVDTNPTLTFTLKSNYGLHIELESIL
jgi:hypothetical protein